MATDALGNTIVAGQTHVLSGVVRRIDGDSILLLTNDGQTALRVKASELVLRDHVVMIPVAAEGDLLIYTGGQWTPFPIGTEGQILKIASGAIAWKDP
jgi:hypothetical protein